MLPILAGAGRVAEKWERDVISRWGGESYASPAHSADLLVWCLPLKDHRPPTSAYWRRHSGPCMSRAGRRLELDKVGLQSRASSFATGPVNCGRKPPQMVVQQQRQSIGSSDGFERSCHLENEKGAWTSDPALLVGEIAQVIFQDYALHPSSSLPPSCSASSPTEPEPGDASKGVKTTLL